MGSIHPARNDAAPSYGLSHTKAIAPGATRSCVRICVSTQALLHAILIRVQPGNEPPGFQAVGEPREPLPRYLRRACPKSRVAVALQRACQELARNVWIVRSNRIGQLLGA